MMSTSTLAAPVPTHTGRPKAVSTPAVALGDKNVMAQVYQKMRGVILQLLVPLLCPLCKEALAKASTKQGLPPSCHGLCKTCKLTLVMKHIPLNNADKTVEQATSLIKARVIAEIEGLLGRQMMRPPTPPPSPKRKISEMSENDDCQSQASKKEIQLPLASDLPIYEAFTEAGVDWCRYCGTTAGSSWRAGPWGPRSLCFRHGRDWSVHKRLDLTEFEGHADRTFPVLQSYCKLCWSHSGIVRRCHGCANGFHAQCYLQRTGRNVSCLLVNPWYCNSTCAKHFETGSLRVTHSTKEKLPLMAYDATDDLDEESRDTVDITIEACRPAPLVLFRLKVPDRPATPMPEEVFVEPKPQKRRFSCPVESLKPAKKTRRPRDPSRNSVPDFLISIDHSAVPRKAEETVKQPVLIPEFKVVSRPSRPAVTSPKQEKITELVYQTRHCRLEEMEKHTRLLKPDVLKTLFGKAA